MKHASIEGVRFFRSATLAALMAMMFLGACSASRKETTDATGGHAAEVEATPPPTGGEPRCGTRKGSLEVGGLPDLWSQQDGYAVTLPFEDAWTVSCAGPAWAEATRTVAGQPTMTISVWKLKVPGGVDMLAIARGMQLRIGKIAADKAHGTPVSEGVDTGVKPTAWREDRVAGAGGAHRMVTLFSPALGPDGTTWGVSASATYPEAADPTVKELAQVSARIATTSFRVPGSW